MDYGCIYLWLVVGDCFFSIMQCTISFFVHCWTSLVDSKYILTRLIIVLWKYPTGTWLLWCFFWQLWESLCHKPTVLQWNLYLIRCLWNQKCLYTCSPKPAISPLAMPPTNSLVCKYQLQMVMEGTQHTSNSVNCQNIAGSLQKTPWLVKTNNCWWRSGLTSDVLCIINDCSLFTIHDWPSFITTYLPSTVFVHHYHQASTTHCKQHY